MTNPPPITRVKRFRTGQTVLVCRCLCGARPYAAEVIDDTQEPGAPNAAFGGGLGGSAKYLVRRIASNEYTHVYDSQVDPL